MGGTIPRKSSKKKESVSALTSGDWKKLKQTFYTKQDRQALEKKIDKKFDENKLTFKSIDEKFAENERAHDRIFLKLIEHDAKMETFVTKDEFHERMDEINRRFDDILVILRSMQTELVACVSALRRHEEKLEEHDHEIKKIKIKVF